MLPSMFPFMPKHRPRVLRLLPALDFGGVESRVMLQARLHDPEDYELRVLTLHRLGAAGETLRAGGTPVDSLDSSPSPRCPRTTLRLAQYLRILRPDVIHASIAEANFHGPLANRLATRAPIITEEVGMPDHSRLARLVYRAIYAGAHTVVGVTQATCDYLATADGAPRERIRLIRNCASEEFFPSPRPSTARHLAAGGPLRVLAVGRLVPVKNQALLVQAAARLRARGVAVSLDIVGEGPLRSDLESQIRAAELHQSVRLLGYQSDVRQRMLDADVFVLPSHSEGCSISLIEAMASGAWPLTSRAAGNLEVLGPLAAECALDGTSVDAWCARVALIASMPGEKRWKVTLAAQDRAYETFSPRRYLLELQELYRSVLAGAAPTTRHRRGTAIVVPH